MAELLRADAALATPRVEVEARLGGGAPMPFAAVPTLLDSSGFDPVFVVETENDGRALLRFGDGEFGLAPEDASTLRANYWVGAGPDGNVGADALCHVVDDGTLPALEVVRNPLAAWGGAAPEPLDRVRLLAPPAFHAEPIRAVTEADYARAAERHPEVAKAVATLRWSGSWHTIFVTVDRIGGRAVDAAFEQELRVFLQRSRLAGYDLEIDGPRFVPLEIEIDVCVEREYFRFDVERALLDALGSHDLPGVGRGFFHQDNFTFGQPVYLSRLYAAIEQVAGVGSAEVRLFQRLGFRSAGELDGGAIPIGRLEIARLDNDPNFPENGALRLDMMGGR